MSASDEEKFAIVNALVRVIGAGLMHREAEHGTSILAVREAEAIVLGNVCPDSVILICGENTYAAIKELKIEQQLMDHGVDQAAAEIERLKKGH